MGAVGGRGRRRGAAPDPARDFLKKVPLTPKTFKRNGWEQGRKGTFPARLLADAEGATIAVGFAFRIPLPPKLSNRKGKRREKRVFFLRSKGRRNFRSIHNFFKRRMEGGAVFEAIQRALTVCVPSEFSGSLPTGASGRAPAIFRPDDFPRRFLTLGSRGCGPLYNPAFRLCRKTDAF